MDETINEAAAQTAFQASLAFAACAVREARWTGHSALVEGGAFCTVAVEFATDSGLVWAVQVPEGLICSDRLAELSSALGRRWT